MPEQKQPDKIVRVGGREFRIFREYDDLVEHDVLVYPDFEESPEYTGEGRPFCLAVQESCEYGRYSGDPDDPDPGDCGCCVWFHREEPFAAIGVCMCDSLKRTDIAREQKEEEK